MKTSQGFLLFVLLFLLLQTSCRGTLHIDRTKNFNSKTTDIEKLVCLDPDFELLMTSGKKRTQRKIKRASAKEIQLNNTLFRNAQKNGIAIEMIDTERLNISDTPYFRDLAPLKREILQASFLQDFINKKGKIPEKQIFNRHESGPVIGSQFSHLAQQYKTPYFSIHGVTSHRKPVRGKLILLVTAPPLGVASFFSPEVDTYYYTIIANVETAEIVYREIRRVDAPASDTNLNAVIYDSFKIIKK